MDFLGHVETLAEDMQHVAKQLNREIILEHKNAVQKPHESSWKSNINQPLRKTIANLYRKDFELLGYQDFLE